MKTYSVVKLVTVQTALLTLAVVLGGCHLMKEELYSPTLLKQAEQGNVKWVSVDDEGIVGVYVPGTGRTQSFRTPAKPEEAQELLAALREKGVHVLEGKAPWTQWWFVPLVILIFIMWSGDVQHFLRSGIAALLYVSLIWWWHQLTPMPEDISSFYTLGALRFKLFSSGPIPYAILWTVLASLHYIYQIFKFQLVPLINARLQDQAALSAVEKQQHAALKLLMRNRQRGFITERVARLHKRWERDGDLTAVIALKNDLLEQDEEKFALAFTAVRWCEVALPLLGFLGTVVGIGGAMGGVSTGVRTLFQGAPMEMALDDLNEGFRGMAVAFDTTFLGLAGLILVGILHMGLRKGLANNLAKARDALTKAVENWSGGGGQRQVVVSLTGIQERLWTSETRLQRLEAAVREGDQRATLFRETAQRMVTHVIRNDPQFESIRRVLLRPVVEFQEVGKDLTLNTAKVLNKRLKLGWKITTFGVSIGSSAGGMLAGEDRQHKPWLLPVTLKGPALESPQKSDERFRKILLLGGTREALALTAGEEGASGRGNQGGTVVSVQIDSDSVSARRLLPGGGSEDLILPMKVGDQNLALVCIHLPHGQGVRVFVSKGAKPAPVGVLPGDRRWDWIETHAHSSSLFALGTPVDGGNLLLCVFRLEYRGASSEGEEEPPEEEPGRGRAAKPPRGELTLVEGDSIELPATLSPAQILPLSAKVLLILDKNGVLHHLDTSRHSEPKVLSHDRWEPSADTVLRAGHSGWVAVAQRGKLSMWQYQPGGWLEPYHEEGSPSHLQIDDLGAKNLWSTPDGSFLFGINEKAIFAWEFPRLAINEFAGDLS